MMRSRDVSRVAGLFGLVALASPVLAQGVQEKVAAAKQAAAQNQAALRSYTWIEKTDISFKGEVKNTKLQSCRYGPDGKVQKTLLSAPAAPEEPSRGRKKRLKAAVVEQKKEELQAEMKAASALVHQYVPPSADKMQAAMSAGKITITPGASTGVRIADYQKAGDSLVLTLDPAAHAMKKIDVDTWLDAPANKVTLDVQMQSLPDGTSYPGTVVLAIPGSHIQVQITNSNYQKIAN